MSVDGYKRTFLLAIFALFLTATLLFGETIPDVGKNAEAWSGEVSSSLSGDGSETTPYMIMSPADLAFLASSVNGGNDFSGKYFSLVSDLDLSSDGVCIGYADENQPRPFNGIFNGNGKKVKNARFAIEETAEGLTYYGLFGYVGGNGRVENLTVENISVVVNENSDESVNTEYSFGGIAGYNVGIVENCSVINLTAENVSKTGGAVAVNAIETDDLGNVYKGTVSGCSASGLSSDTGCAGGIVCENYGSVSDCLYEGSVTFGGYGYGGIVYKNEGGTVTASRARNLDLATEGYFGGLVYENGGSIDGGYVTGSVRAYGVGGICHDNAGVINSVFFAGDVEATVSEGKAAGLCVNNGGTITNASALGTITASYVSGTVAVFQQSGIMTDVAVSVNLFGEDCFIPYGEVEVFYDGAGCSAPSGATAFFINGASGLSSALGDWICENGKMPAIRSLCENSDFSTDYEQYLSAAYSVTLDGETVSVRTGLSLFLPTRERTGYTFEGWTDGERVYNGLNTFSDGTALTPKFRLNEIIFIRTSGNASKVYDGAAVVITAEFDFPLPLTYSWEWSSDGEEYVVTEGTTAALSLVTVSQSGYYRCTASYSDGESATETKSAVVVATIAKATYESVSYPYDEGRDKIDGGEYCGKSLSDYSLSAGFFWSDETIIPTVSQTVYSAYYNADKDNYNDYPVMVNFSLSKGSYSSITYDYGEGSSSVYGGKYCGKTLSSIALNDNFRWLAEETVFDVGTNEYDALYNADSDNYFDFSLKIKLSADKGEYNGITHRSFSGVYSSGATLADYVPDEFFVWVAPSTVPVVSVKEYDAVYNADPERYEDFYLTITVNLAQAEPVVNPVIEKTVAYLGERMPSIVLSEGDTDGNITWESDTLIEGEYDYSWKYVPADGNYLTVTGKEIITVYLKKLISLRVATQPDKTVYRAFESFDRSGMEVIAEFNGGTEEECLAYDVIYGSGNEYFVFGETEVTISYEYDGVEKRVGLNITVLKIEVEIPVDVNEYRYTGEAQSCKIASGNFYTVECESKILPGTYYATVALKDKINYVWKDSDDEDKSIEWEILPMWVTIPQITGDFTYNGEIQYCGIPESDFYDIENGYGRVDAGKYEVTLTLTDYDLYRWYDTEDVSVVLIWEIGVKYVEDPIAVVSEYVYCGFPIEFLYEGEGTEGCVPDVTEATAAGTYTVVYTLKNNNYKWSNDELRPERELTFVIKPKPLTVPTITTSFVYDGTQKSAYAGGDVGIAAEGASAKNAGTYEVVFSLVNGNYCWSDGSDNPISSEWIIEKRKIEKPVNSDDELVYDGSLRRAPIAESAEGLYLLSGNTGTAAGDYTATAIISDKNNYCWGDGSDDVVEIVWSISRKIIDLPSVAGTYVYDGGEQEGKTTETECVIRDNIARDAGVYFMKINLPDKDNYVWRDGGTEEKTLEWRIQPMRLEKPYALRECSYLPYTQSAPINESQYYTLAGAEGKNAGIYTATATLKDKTNCVWADGTTADVSVRWQINKASVAIPVVIDELVYNGAEQSVKTNVSDLFSVVGKGKDAGEYVATASLTDTDNYCWEDGTTAPINLVFHIFSLTLVNEGGNDALPYDPGTLLPVPEREGYNFGGWYLTPDFSDDAVNVLYSVDKDTKLYAKWLADDIGEQTATEKKSGLSVGAIAGIAVCCVCALIAIALVIFSLVNRGTGRRNRRF